jgi:2'-5' RNA ligase
MSRLFVAVWPPSTVVVQLEDLEQPRDQGVRWVPMENRHITLHFLGEADPEAVMEALDAASLLRAHAHLGPAIDALTQRALVIPVTGLDELADAVRTRVRKLGSDQSRRAFVGHLTLARLARDARPHRSIGRPFSADFVVGEIALVESTLTSTGAVYETLASWPTH